MYLIKEADILHIKETLLSCRTEFEELEREKDWYVTTGEVMDMIDSSLEIIRTHVGE